MQQTIAQVRCNSFHEWQLMIKGTDTCVLMYLNRHPDLDPFPGAELRDRLTALGWMPNRHTQVAVASGSTVERTMHTALAGWEPSKNAKDSNSLVWTIPVSRSTG